MGDLDQRIEYLFYILKIEKNLKGYAYLENAVKCRYVDPFYKGKIYSHLYKKLAKDFHTSPMAIERNIRTVLSASWTKNYSIYQYELYDYILFTNKNIPTATRFIEQTVLLLDRDEFFSMIQFKQKIVSS